MVKTSRKPVMGISPKLALSSISTSMKEEFLKLCGEAFDHDVAKQDIMIREMDLHYKFKFGQVVKMTNNTSIMDGMLGVANYEYGVIVGHSDFEKLMGDRSYYRVHTQGGHPFLGREESLLEPVTDEDEIPENLRVMDVRVCGRIGGKTVKALHVYDTHI